MRPLAKGIEQADSIVFNPHKWLLTNFDCSCLFVRDVDALTNTFSLSPEYLKTSEQGASVNYRDWGLGLGRRFRSLKLWFVFRLYGLEKMREYIESHLSFGELLEDLISKDESFKICAPRLFNLVCFKLNASDEDNMKLMASINQSGKLFITHAKFNGEIVLRIAPGGVRTEEKHIREAWRLIKEHSLRL